MADNLERILQKVRHLLALAEDSGASMNESTLAFQRAQKLMNEYAIQDWQLHESERCSDPIVEQSVKFYNDPLAELKKDLADIVARANRCRSYFSWHKSRNNRKIVNRVVFYGTESDCRKSEMIWTSMELFRAAAWKGAAREEGEPPLAPFRNGFYLGFAQRIEERYQDLRQEMQTTAAGRELVSFRDKQLDQYRDGLQLSDKYKPNATEYWPAGLNAGRLAAETVGLGVEEVDIAHSYLPADLKRLSQ